ncbi:MAG: stage II sporulation protein P [Firmicutes bacterium]|nr:stage II sporulation protein P [Bacillota bacterium]
MALRPRRWPPAALLAYLAAVAVTGALLWTRPGPPLAVRVLAPERAVSTAPELQERPQPWWVAFRVDADLWERLFRWAWPLFPGSGGRPADGGAPGGEAPDGGAPGVAAPAGGAGAVGSLPPGAPAVSASERGRWTPGEALQALSLLLLGIRWDTPLTWLLADLPALADAAPPAPPAPSEAAVEDARPLVVTGAEPVVLIYHTHATESFLPELPGATGPQDAFTTDRRRNMVHVGDVLAAALAELGVPVAHSREEYDAAGRVGAYERSLAGIEPILARYPSIRLIVDLHRDSVGRDRTVAVAGGRRVARVMLVVGTDRLLSHPHWRENAAFAARVAAAMEAAYPGLVRTVDGQPYMVEEGRYNQHVAPGAILIELGGAENTLAEEDATARLLAPILADLVKSGRVPPRRATPTGPSR